MKWKEEWVNIGINLGINLAIAVAIVVGLAWAATAVCGQGVQERVKLPDNEGVYWSTIINDGSETGRRLVHMFAANAMLSDMWLNRTQCNYYGPDSDPKRWRHCQQSIEPKYAGSGPMFVLQAPDFDGNGRSPVIYKVRGSNIPNTPERMVAGIRAAVREFVAGGHGLIECVDPLFERDWLLPAPPCPCPKPKPKPTPPPKPDDKLPILIPDTVGPDEEEPLEEELPLWAKAAILAGLGLVGAGGGYVYKKR